MQDTGFLKETYAVEELHTQPKEIRGHSGRSHPKTTPSDPSDEIHQKKKGKEGDK